MKNKCIAHLAGHGGFERPIGFVVRVAIVFAASTQVYKICCHQGHAVAGAGNPHVHNLRDGGGTSANVFTSSLIPVAHAAQTLGQRGAIGGAFVVKKIMIGHVVRVRGGGLLQLAIPAQRPCCRVTHTTTHSACGTNAVHAVEHV